MFTKDDVDAGIKGIYERIQRYPFEYSDDVGARFFVHLYEYSPAAVREFYERFAIAGYQLEFNEREMAALEKAKNETTATKLLADTTIKNNLNQLLQRRTLVRMGLAVGAGILLKLTAFAGREVSLRVGESPEAREFQSIQQQLERGSTTEQERQALEKRMEDLQNNGLYKLFNSIADKIKHYGIFAIPALIVLGEIGLKASAAVAERKEKQNEILDHLTQFCNVKLNRIPAVMAQPSNERVR
jgi:hypothetical protein